MIAQRISVVLSAVLSVFLLLSCTPSEPNPPSDAIQIRGAGATFPAPLYRKWIAAYQEKHPKVVIDYKAIGSGDGIKLFMSESVDFGASDAAMSDEQIANTQRGVQLVPATAGIITLAYNLKGVPDLKLPREVYVDIFLGEIRKWNDKRIQAANPSATLPARDVTIVARQESSGTTYAFTNHLSAVSAKWRDRGPGTGKVVDWPGSAMLAKGNEGVAGRIRMSDGAIGYVEYGYAQRAGLAMASLENRAGRFVQPVAGSGTATLMHHAGRMPENLRIFFPDPEGDTSYPIVTYSWLLLYRQYTDSTVLDALKGFVEWGLTEGQSLSEATGYCRLPDRVVQLAMAGISQIR